MTTKYNELSLIGFYTRKNSLKDVISGITKILNMDCGLLGIGKLQYVSQVHPRVCFCMIYEPKMVFKYLSVRKTSKPKTKTKTKTCKEN